MGVLARTVTRTLARWAPEQKVDVGMAIPVGQDGIAQYPQMPGLGRYSELAREGYSLNDLVYAAIEERATSAAEPRLACFTRPAQGDPEKVTQHPVLDLFEAPNPFQDRFSFMASIPMFLDVAGNAFIHKERSAGGRVVQLWHLRPDRVWVVPDAQRHIRGYEYRLGGLPYFLPAQDVIHLRTRAVWDDYYGLPPLAVAAQWVDIGNAAAAFTRAFFRNAGVPSGLLNIQRSVTVAERDLIRSQFRREYGGPSGWHNTLVLDGGDASYTAMGLPLGERGIALAALDELIEAHVVRPFGVPLELIGARLSMRGQRSAAAEARTGFWDETLIPLYKLIAAQLQMGFADEPILGQGWDFLDFDLSQVQALQEDADALMARAVLGYEKGILQRGEARTMVGKAATDDDKVFFLGRSSGLVRPDEVLVPGAAAALPENVPPDPNADPNAPPPNPLKPTEVPDGHTGVSGHVRRLPTPAQLHAAADALVATNGHTNGAGH